MVDQFSEIFEEISDTTCIELKNELIFLAIRYSRIRVGWKLSDTWQRLEMEDSRTRYHDAFIDSSNILSRNMEKADENNSC